MGQIHSLSLFVGGSGEIQPEASCMFSITLFLMSLTLIHTPPFQFRYVHSGLSQSSSSTPPQELLQEEDAEVTLCWNISIRSHTVSWE